MPRIGQILSESVPLSVHDVEEILHEQKTTRLRFGDAALALGKARPDQVWAAWLSQLGRQPIDLDRTPIDPSAVAAMPTNLAVSYGLVPLRVRGDQMVVACADALPADALAHVERRCGYRVVVAVADAAAVERQLTNLYPAAVSAA